MTDKIKLYPCFEKWKYYDNIVILGDTHFDDEDAKAYRGNISSEEIVKNINKTCGKKSVFICLGDVGNVEWVKKIKGYKVLVMGNHDSGRSNFERKVITKRFSKDLYTREDALNKMKEDYSDCEYSVSEEYDFHRPFESWVISADNKLFCEVYEGPLIINEKIILSHEPIDIKWMLNVHGHIHDKNHKNDNTHFNVCAEHVGYTPIRLTSIIESGLLSKINTLHRETIDKATERKRKRDK